MATKEVSTVNSTNYLIISDNDQNQVIINQPNNNIIQVTIPSNANNITQNENIVVVNDPSSKQINIIDQGVRVIQLTALGPQGPQGLQGAPGSSLPFYQSGSANIWVTTASLQISNLVDINGSLIITGSLIISGSNTFKNIGLGLFTGSLLVTGSAFYNGKEILTTEITGGLVPTSSFNAFTSSFNTFTSSYSTGSFTGSFTGSLLGTSSYSNQSLSSSYALTASFALNGGGTTVDTGSFVTTSSFNAFTSSINTATSSFVTNNQTSSFTTTSSFNNFTSSYNTGSFTGSFTGSLLGTSSYSNQSLSSSYALTASYLDNYIPPFPYTGSAIITGSLLITGSTISTLGFTGSLLGTASVSITESRTITFNLGSIPTPITTGSKANSIFYSPYLGSIKGFILTANTGSTATLDIWKRNNLVPTSSDTIITTNKPQLINNQLTSSYNVSGWITSFNPNDVFLINVETNTSASNLSLQLITEIYK